MSLKAYLVSCSDDDHGSDVAFAESANDARKHGNGDNCDCGYINLRARRAHYLDKYVDSGVTLKTLVENHGDHGWHALCAECESPLYGDHKTIVWADKDSRAFCSPACFEKFKQTWLGHPNCPNFLISAGGIS